MSDFENSATEEDAAVQENETTFADTDGADEVAFADADGADEMAFADTDGADETDPTEPGGISFDDDADDDGGDYIAKQKRRKCRKIIIISLVAAAVVFAAAAGVIRNIRNRGADDKDIYTDAAVERRTVMNTITGSSSIEPNDSYNVISMHSGDITADYISEGGAVKKGDKLYQFDDEEARNTLTNARNALTKAQQAYVDAVKTKTQTVSSNDLNTVTARDAVDKADRAYQDAVKTRAQAVSSNNASTQSARNALERAQNSLDEAEDALEDRYVMSEIDGKVGTVYVEDGDNVAANTAVADVFDDSYMKLRLPFNEFDASMLHEGADAEVNVAGVSETIPGTVTEVSSAAIASDAHTMVVYATVEVANPGALTVNDLGSAVVDGVACADAGYFEYAHSQPIYAKTSGTVRQLSVSEGDSVRSGTQVAFIESETLENTYENALLAYDDAALSLEQQLLNNDTYSQDSSVANAQLSYDDAVASLQRQLLNNDTYSQDSGIKNAELALDDARLQLQSAQDAVDDFVVEAPIDGTVVTKNAKAGDTIDSANGTEPLCIIYDLSCVKFSLDIDETEIALVRVGQKAKVTADAVEGEFEGRVIKVPVDGVNENGVTTYTIDIQIDNYGALLPGMNIDAEIVAEEAADVLTVPVNSVNRGNIVFVKDDGTPHENDVTDKLSGNAPQSANAPQNTNAPQGGNESGAGDIAANLPRNIEVPEGYRAIVVETGINDSDYIEIKSGLKDGDMVRTLNTQMSSAGASFGDMNSMFGGMNGGMPGGMNGGMPGGMGGGMSGGMGGGMSGGLGGPGGGR